MEKLVLEGREILYEVTNFGCWYVTNFKPNKLPKGKVGYYLIRTSPGVRQYIHRMIKGSLVNYLIRHTCDDALCINPDHLIEGDHQDNADDAVEAGAYLQATCLRGHDLTVEDNTRMVYRKNRRPNKTCRICESIRRRKPIEYNA